MISQASLGATDSQGMREDLSCLGMACAGCFLGDRPKSSRQRGLSQKIKILVGISFGTFGAETDDLETSGQFSPYVTLWVERTAHVGARHLLVPDNQATPAALGASASEW
jgi:hypothetical protein